MSEQALSQDEQEAIKAVEDAVYRRYHDLTTSNVWGWDEEELDRVKTHAGGYLEFSVEDVRIEETEVTGDGITYYVEATLVFAVTSGEDIVSDPETYQAYKSSDGKNEWIVEWHSS